MTIVLPIFFAAVGFGFFVKRMTNAHWVALCTIIALVIVYNFVKPPKPLAPLPGSPGANAASQSGGSGSSDSSGGG